MAGKSGKPIFLYLLIIVCLAVSGYALFSMLGRVKEYDESADAYRQLWEEVAARGDAGLTEEEPTEEPYIPQGPEEEETDQEETIWRMEARQPMPWVDATPTEEQRVSGLEADNIQDMPSVAARRETGAPERADQEETDEPVEAHGEVATATIAPLNVGATVSATSRAASAVAPTATVSATGTVQTVTPTITPTVSPTPTPAATPVPTHTVEPWMERVVEMDNVQYTVDFAYLMSLNEDVVAWLIQEGTDINYPVMQGKNNDYYLNHMFNRRENKDGSLFMDSGNSKYFGDANTYIYGHNTKVGTMFGSLPNYADQEYYNQHPRMILLTPYADYCIDLFACRMSLVEDESSWRLKQFERKAEFTEYINGLKADSLFKSDVTPEWGDQFLVLCTCTNVAHGQRYVLYGRMRPIRYTTEQTVTLTKIDMDSRPTLNGKREVGTLGKLQLYAQNDELWARFRYENKGSTEKRGFGDGGAGPTAVAMAVANLVPKEELPRMTGYALATSGYTFCTCSVNQYFCNRLHAQYQIESPEEFVKYLPLAFGSFATGNNIWKDQSRTKRGGTNLLFMEYVAGIYGLELKTTKNLDEAVRAVENGAMAVCVASSGPFAKGSHYVVMAGLDDEYLYVLDPYRRDSYEATDRERMLEMVTPNAVRVRRENMNRLGLKVFYVLEKKEP